MSKYDVIVVGGGHAGAEAALVSARLGCTTLLMTISLDTICAMPCSPSIGGLGKGHLVKEIDALGGAMARAADQTAIQFRVLNTSKGAAVQGTRTQNDKLLYHKTMKGILEKQAGLDIIQGMAEEIVIEDNRVIGLVDNLGNQYHASAIVLATGTFLHGLMHIGSKSFHAGRAWEFSSDSLADNLRSIGFYIGRLKTGTPPRLKRSSIDFSCLKRQDGDEKPRFFSSSTTRLQLPQQPCYITATNQKIHRLITENVYLSPLYNGTIKGTPARYCPSLEDKVMKFPDHESHQIILEPEGLDTVEIYGSGLGNSFPPEFQLVIVRSVKGLEDAKIIRPAYAIEYDFCVPNQLLPTLETRLVPGLYMAGQINGTSGYEEAGAQGIWAGVNAALKVQKRSPFILSRSESYMGVMVDDLITRSTDEPYRMFTSRAEYRLFLREDNAEYRLMDVARELALIDKEKYESLKEEQIRMQEHLQRLERTYIKPSYMVNKVLGEYNSSPIKEATPLINLLRRPDINMEAMEKIDSQWPGLDPRVARQVEIQVKYEGYLKKQLQDIKQFKEMDRIKIPYDIDYDQVPGLSNEIREKLKLIRPFSLAQAYRISGMTPAALSVLLVFIKGYNIMKNHRQT